MSGWLSRRFMRRVVRAGLLRSSLGALFRRLLRSFGTATCNGVPVLVDNEDAGTGPAHARVVEALRLLASTAPRRFARFRADDLALYVDGGLARRTGRSGIYVELAGCIVLDTRVVLEQSDAWLASALVHESVHARMRRAGISYRRNKAREEQRCCAEQVDFLRHLPAEYHEEVDQLVAHIQAALVAPVPWYLQSRRNARAEVRARERAAAQAPRPVEPFAPRLRRLGRTSVARVDGRAARCMTVRCSARLRSLLRSQ